MLIRRLENSLHIILLILPRKWLGTRNRKLPTLASETDMADKRHDIKGSKASGPRTGKSGIISHVASVPALIILVVLYRDWLAFPASLCLFCYALSAA